jgi:hypothetical protein
MTNTQIIENINLYEGVKIEMVTVHHANYISIETKTYSYLADKDKFYYTHGGILGMMDAEEAMNDILYTLEMADNYDKMTIFNGDKEITQIENK